MSIRSAPDSRATAVGWTSGVGRFGAVFGPWFGRAAPRGGRRRPGFTAFALAGVSSMVFIGIVALRTPRCPERSGSGRRLVTAG
ncbi:hypothetical protein ACQ4WX_08375 [Streptomyces lasalocidi]